MSYFYEIELCRLAELGQVTGPEEWLKQLTLPRLEAADHVKVVAASTSLDPAQEMAFR